ncbi:biofilm regulation diguanylate cyclase SiaD [Pigmentiphaga sp.]|uniref:biofilm regulation diguanylate cyclase SiaD n=1 Tax=Pigmentiphaga sp. TaxID=1977564 RepID=UPI00128D766D|nr:biofilm regulation diguanylate cyclase SiaD [Pigmentiphaga sp.]MPS28892.1 GGDEF domain-containing protein [Alcaligenaceae bacterium SAGV5]MPS52646.1 GGDEF domain-containing protein [Alcaligenaceae bacterium SAGV3]MPT60451.1 GGDEF domain-containing protein [Alcaligenaceae bacterium]
MKRDIEDLGRRIEQLLAQPEYRDHPLREALDEVWRALLDQTTRLDRVTHISDGYQSLSKERENDLDERFQKQLRKLEKLARISDHYQRMMQDLNVALSDASNRDVLTGLANRRHLMHRLKEESERASRSGLPYTIAMLDIDHFKRINDTLGHAAGDRALIEVGRILQSSLREYDLCGRWGGEEFMLIMPGTTLVSAHALAQRVCKSIREQAGEPQAGQSISASVGISAYRHGEHYSDAVERADAALLEAKRRGRDCIMLSEA